MFFSGRSWLASALNVPFSRFCGLMYLLSSRFLAVRPVIALFLFLFLDHRAVISQVSVRSYYRQDGTYVQSHTRSSPSSGGSSPSATSSGSSAGSSSGSGGSGPPPYDSMKYKPVARKKPGKIPGTFITETVYVLDHCGLTVAQMNRAATGNRVLVQSEGCMIDINSRDL